MAGMSVPKEVLEDLDIIDSSPGVVYLLDWASKKIDMTKISSQVDLTRWLQETIKKESERLGIDEREYKKRFKGMIKFFTQPDLGLKTVEEIQTKIAEDILDEVKSESSRIRDYEDLVQLISEYKDVELPPLAPTKMKEEFRSIMNRLYTYRSKVRAHPDYPELLKSIKEYIDLIKSKRYEMLPPRLLRRRLARLAYLRFLANKIRRDLKLPFTIFEDRLNSIYNVLSKILR